MKQLRTYRIPLGVMIFFLLFVTLKTGAQQSENCTLIGRWANGPCYADAVVDHIAYFGNGGYLEIVDFSNPANPVELGRVLTPSEVLSVVVSGAIAYVANDVSGLRVIDVSDPSSPYEMGFVDTDGNAQGVAVNGNYAYVADGWANLRVIDVTDPTDPFEAGLLFTGCVTQGVVVSGNYAYLAGGSAGLRVIDVTDPTNPYETGFFDTDEMANNVAVSGTFAYVADGEGGLCVIDVSDPNSPFEVGFFDPGGYINNVELSGNIAYVTDNWVGLRVIDITDPANPSELGLFSTDGYSYDVSMSNSTAYVADSWNGLRVIDVTDPSSPSETGFFETAGSTFDVTLSDNIAYVANDEFGLSMIDVSDPSNPSEAGFFDTGGTVNGVAVSGSYAYVADGSKGLRVIDVTDPSSPSEVGFFDTGGIAQDVVLSDGYAYVADGNGGLRVIDISDPSGPFEVGFFGTGGSAYSVVVSGNTAYVADGDEGLRVIDVSDPSGPFEAGFFDTDGNSRDVALNSNTAYVADYFSGLRVIDVTDPSDPSEVGFFDTDSYACGVSFSDGYAYVADGDDGLRVIDVTDPSSPSEVGFFDTGHCAFDVTLSDNYVYVVDRDDGFYIIGKFTPKLVVTTTNDSGGGTLRWAIEQANSNAGPDTIQFNIPTDDAGFDGTVWTIHPLSSLPEITDGGTVIDGNSQTINQSNSNPGGPEVILDGRVSSTYISGLEIHSSDNVITGLVISGFHHYGIYISGSGVRDNWIWGNYIGTTPSGSDTLGNGDGILISNGSSHNTIGGDGENEGNIISGNHEMGIFISSSDSNVVIGNKIGTDVTGSVSLGNQINGIYLGWNTADNRIGGSMAGERNILSGNGDNGIYIYGKNIRDNIIQGNFIGVDINGTSALGNGGIGITLGWYVSNTIIGGLLPGEGNVISGNDHHGIKIYRDEADSNRVMGNFIGTGTNGESDIGNGQYGIELSGNTQYNQIGPGNVIRYNGWHGVAVRGDLTLYNRITQNSISENQEDGIGLLYGGNGELASPVITDVGSVEGTAPANASVEIFSGPDDEGLNYEATVEADGSGNFAWSGTVSGLYVTATATDAEGNTSEFSEPVLSGKLVVTSTNDDGQGSLRWAIGLANENAGPDTILFDIPPVDEGFNGTVWTIQLVTELPAINDSGTVIDGTSQTSSQGNTNPEGPEIVLDGRETGEWGEGFTLRTACNVISGFVVSGFSDAGIVVNDEEGRENWIWGNYIGTDAAGSDTLGNGDGIRIWHGAMHNTVGGTDSSHRNVISGNHFRGIYLEADSNLIIGNYIGTDRTGTEDLGDQTDGIHIRGGAGNRIGGSGAGERNIISGNGSGIYIYGTRAEGNVIQGNYIGTDFRGTSAVANGIGIQLCFKANLIGGLAGGETNVISGNRYEGVYISGAEVDSNRVIGNFIGTTADGESNLGNGTEGIMIQNGAQHNQIGPGNTIRYNQGRGMFITGVSTLYNTITQNSISDNQYAGINLADGGNGELASPVVTDVGSVSGTAPPNTTVEIFSGHDDEGRTYEATVTADGAGNFTWAGTPAGRYVTATATDSTGNTSEFSAGFDTPVVEEEVIVPEEFSLYQNYPNPFNPETTIRFGVKEPCRVILRVYDLLAREVAKIVNEQYQSGVYEVRFDATGLSSGLYFYRIQMGSFQSVKKMVVLE